MFDFIYKYSTSIYLALEIIAAVTGIVLLNKYRHTAAKYFIYFLVYIVAIVVIGKYSYYVRDDGFLNFLEGTLFEKNYGWFNLFWSIGGTVFFAWYFQKILNGKKSKRLLKISLVVFLIISISEAVLTFPKFFNTSMPFIKLSSLMVILQCVFFYFLEVLQSDKILYFYKSIGFYICCSILFLWLIQTPLVFFEHYFNTADKDYIFLRNLINLIAISSMYIIYTVGLIVSNPDYD